MKRFNLQSLILLGIGFVLYLVANSLISDLFTRRFVYLQIIVLLVVLGVLLWKKGWHAHTNTAASILTIVGVLGTFIGIYLGLQEFTISNDSDKMQESISKLLDGLKFAFGTSIVGIGSALLLKGAISPIAKHFQNEITPDENAMEKFINGLKIALEPGEIPSKLDVLTEAIKRESNETRKVLDSMKTELTSEQKEQGEQTRKTLTEMQSAIIGEQTNNLKQLETLTTTVSEKQNELLNGVKDALTPIQTSLMDEQTGVLTKLEALTTTVSEKHDALKDEFETFSNNVAESITRLATSELIDALRTVIDEFNTNMVNQFGENFRHLNEAVDRMVGWQEQYRQQMDELASEFRIAAESIEQSRGSLENIANSSSTIADRSHSIVACAENLERILPTLNGQLEAFSRLREQAQEVFPLIEGRLNELTNGFSSTVQEAITNSQTSMEAQREALQEQNEQLKNIVDGIDDFTTRIDDVTQNVSTTVTIVWTVLRFLGTKSRKEGILLE